MNAGGLPMWITPAVIAGMFLLMLVAEAIAPLRRTVEPKSRRVARNLTTGALALAVVTLLQVLLVPLATLSAGERVGLLQWLNLPRPWSVIAAIVLLDYTLWVWHWANHRVPLLWRFHLVHHVDRDLDASTALRFHFGELALSLGWRVLQIVLIGADGLSLALWQCMLFVSILFHHANVRLPRPFESALARVVVTPRMHGIHHSAQRDHTDSNWSSLLTVWDFLHGTFRFDVPDATIRIGVPAYQDSRKVTIGKILALPFRRGGDDWREAVARGSG